MTGDETYDLWNPTAFRTPKRSISRIAVVVSSLEPGGAEQQAITIVKNLTSHVDLIELVVIKEAKYRELSTNGIACRRLDLSLPKGSVSSYVSAVKKLRRYFMSFDIETVFAFGTSVTSLSIVSALRLDVKVFLCERTVPWKHKLDKINCVARWLTYRNMAGAICQTKGVSEWLRHHYCPPVTHVIPNFPPTKKLPEPVQLPYRFNIVCVARFRPEKGQKRLLQAFDLVHESIPEYGLVFVGDGPDRAAVKEYSDTLSIKEKITYIGDVENVVDFYAVADIVVLPSYYEGYPNALCEAMQQGKPCIAFREAIKHTELIADGVNGLLCDETVTGLAQAILTMASDESLRSRLGEAAALAISAVTAEIIREKWLIVIAQAQTGKICAA